MKRKEVNGHIYHLLKCEQCYVPVGYGQEGKALCIDCMNDDGGMTITGDTPRKHGKWISTKDVVKCSETTATGGKLIRLDRPQSTSVNPNSLEPGVHLFRITDQPLPFVLTRAGAESKKNWPEGSLKVERWTYDGTDLRTYVYPEGKCVVSIKFSDLS